MLLVHASCIHTLLPCSYLRVYIGAVCALPCGQHVLNFSGASVSLTHIDLLGDKISNDEGAADLGAPLTISRSLQKLNVRNVGYCGILED